MRKPGPIYVSLFYSLQEAARRCGYTLAIHGSVARDMDLIVVPWDEKVTSQEELIEELRKTCNGIVPKTRTSKEGSVKKNPIMRAHDRACWAIRLDGGAYLDISVMPIKS